jgi:16S rRNA (guanine966-N2)-methyltransferase
VARKADSSAHRIRIIGGRWRGRRIRFPEHRAIRPTPDRVRETLFNWLVPDIEGARCLDLFAGTGVLGIEALSRGAASVTCVEQDPRAAQAIRRSADILKASGLRIVQDDVLAFLNEYPAQRSDVAFVDPPYGSQLQPAVCQLLEAKGWLAEGALVYVESHSGNRDFDHPSNWQCVRAKQAGRVDYRLFHRRAE